MQRSSEITKKTFKRGHESLYIILQWDMFQVKGWFNDGCLYIGNCPGIKTLCKYLKCSKDTLMDERLL